jgi:hypothetical protein
VPATKAYIKGNKKTPPGKTISLPVYKGAGACPYAVDDKNKIGCRSCWTSKERAIRYHQH